MKTRYSTLDIAAAVVELRRFCGMRVNNVYDVDHKTYIIRLQKPDTKITLLLESGAFIHATTFDWPKQTMPSGFSMKLRKHIRQKRLEAVEQVGVDRIVLLTFGTEEHAIHVILELYDRGNIVLADSEYTILNVLRPRTDRDKDVRFAVRETYPLELAKQSISSLSEAELETYLTSEWKGKPGDQVRRALVPLCTPGPALLEHCMLAAGLPANLKMSAAKDHLSAIHAALKRAEEVFHTVKAAGTGYGVIVCRKDAPVGGGGGADSKSENQENEASGGALKTEPLTVYHEFHPMLFDQHAPLEPQGLVNRYESFNTAVDEFISKIESQKIDLKAAAQERTAMKKLDGIRQDHFKRLDALRSAQDSQAQKGALIEMNADLVEKALLVIRSAVAAQISWPEIEDMLSEAQAQNDPVASCIKKLKLETNHISLELTCPEMDEIQIVDVDLSLGAFANARKYYVGKKQAGVKEQKTLQVSEKALKNAEKKTADTLKQVQVKTKISKARKTYWFEKFFWFISTEGYVIVGGRDAQQNEVIVKRYLRPGDVYVHADIRGASSVVVKNRYGPNGGDIPPKTLNEAGMMAVCYSAAWEAKVIASAWWVYHDQVSKTAPSGEYLTPGSFMIRGRKNPLTPAQLVMGFGLLFRLADEGDELVGGGGGEDGKIGLTDQQGNVGSRGFWDRGATRVVAEDTTGDEGSPPSERNGDEEENIGQTSEGHGDLAGDFEDLEVKDDDNSEAGDHRDDTPSVNEQEQMGKSVDNQSESQSELQDKEISPSHSGNKASEGEEEADEFPDIDIKLDIARSVSKTSETVAATGMASVHDDDNDDRASMASSVQTKGSNRGGAPSEETTAGGGSGPNKRGKKGKMKKMKEKYKDQDEEDREMMLQLLGSTGEPKEPKGRGGKKKRGGVGSAANKQPQKAGNKKPQPVKKTREEYVASVLGGGEPDTIAVDPAAEPAPADGKVGEANSMPSKSNTGGADPASAAPEVEIDVTDDVDVSRLDSDLSSALRFLTPVPTASDELLFCLPVCAPYNVLTNYKYKVKLTPGTGKRGAASKTAMSLFIRGGGDQVQVKGQPMAGDSQAQSQLERDLIKALDNMDMARNFPGRVKLSAPQLSQSRKK